MWTDEMGEAFSSVCNKALSNHSSLVIPPALKGIGAILSVKRDGKEMPGRILLQEVVRC